MIKGVGKKQVVERMIMKPLNVLALMSGTSFESIKYAFILTDGVDIYQTFFSGAMPISEFLRTKIELILGKDIHFKKVLAFYYFLC